MLKRTLFFCLLIPYTSLLFAQEKNTLGFRIGMSQSTIHGSYVDYIGSSVPGNVPPYSPEDKLGIEFSALGYYSFGKLLGLNYGLGFIQKGGTLNNHDLGYTVDPSLDYLFIPIGVNVKPIQLERFSVHLSANVIANILLSSEQAYLNDHSMVESSKVIFGYSLGGFFRYKLNDQLALQGDVQFVGDLNPFFKTTELSEDLEMKTKGQVYSIGLVSAISQESFSSTKELSLILRAGYVSSSLYGSYVDYQRNSSFGEPYGLKEKQGFEVGAQLYLQLFKPLYFVTGLGIIQKGGAIDDRSAVYPVDVTLTYLSVPLALAINPINTNKVSLFFTTGLTNNIELSSKQEFLKGTNPDGLLPEESNTFILGYAMGGAIRYKLNDAISLQADAQVMADFTPFYERDLGGNHYEMKTKGNSFSAGVVYHLK